MRGKGGREDNEGQRLLNCMQILETLWDEHESLIGDENDKWVRVLADVEVAGNTSILLPIEGVDSWALSQSKKAQAKLYNMINHMNHFRIYFGVLLH